MGARPKLARLFRVQDPRDLWIECTVQRFEQHILGESEHEELRDHRLSIARAISNPLAIYRSARNANSEVYYAPSDLPAPFDSGYVRVIVEFRPMGIGVVEGEVLTAMWRNRPARGEVIIW
jgi:hypothetical protein